MPSAGKPYAPVSSKDEDAACGTDYVAAGASSSSVTLPPTGPVMGLMPDGAPPAPEVVDSEAFFASGPRPHRDRWAAWLFFSLQLAVVVVGLVAQAYQSPASPFVFGSTHIVETGDTSLCGGPKPADARDLYHTRQLGTSVPLDGPPPPAPPPLGLLGAAIGWLAGVLVLCAAAGYGLLFILKTSAPAVVTAVVALQIAIPALLGLLMLAAGSFWGLLLIGLAALVAYGFYTMRDQLALCAKLLSLSAIGLEHNPALLAVAGLAKLAVGGMAVSTGVWMQAALGNGELALGTCSRQGPNDSTETFACCAWAVRPWVPAYLCLAAVFMLWTCMLGLEFVVYSTGGTVAQWYWAPLGSATVANAKRSVMHAVGPSWGTLCYGSLLLTAVELVRAMVRKARDRANGTASGIAAAILGCVVDCIAALVSQFTKFATIVCAIKGQGFCEGAATTMGLLSRQGLNTYAVWWLPELVLSMAAFWLAAAAGLAAYLLSLGSFKIMLAGAGEAGVAPAGLYAAVVGGGAFALGGLVLGLLAKLLLYIVDAVYLCYAMDLEHQLVAQPAVHELMGALPIRPDALPPPPSGSYVQQPDGGGAYAPYQPQQQQYFAPQQPPYGNAQPQAGYPVGPAGPAPMYTASIGPR